MPEQRAAEEGPGGPPGGSPGGAPQAVQSPRPVSLTRLLSVAVLTPAQAVLVTEQLLEAASTRDTGLGTSLTETTLGEVTVTGSGEVEVGAGLGGSGPSVAELLEQVVQNARRLPAHPRHEHVRLLRELEDVARDPAAEPGARARQLEASLVDVVGPDARVRLSGQLAALVHAFAHVSRPEPADEATFRGAPTPAPAKAASLLPATPSSSRAAGRAHHRPDRARHAPTRPSRGRAVSLRRRSRPRRAGLVALVLAVALAGSGYVLLRGPGAALVESFGAGSDPDAPAAAAPSPPAVERADRAQPQPRRRQAVPALAERSAGPVTAVALEKVSGCRPGGACQVRVTVRFRPSSTAQPIAWKVGAARLCERGVAWSPPTSVTAQPGWTTVYAHSTLQIPEDGSRALLALTTTPAKAQSRPVALTGSSLRC